MKALVCEMCNSNDLVKQDGYFVCQNCGTKYSVEEAKKLMVDVSGSIVKIDTSDELNNYYEIARRAKNDNNTENALKYYDLILAKDPNSWEANFYTVYYQALSCKIAGISNAAISISNCENTVLSLIKKNLSKEEQVLAVKEIISKCKYISKMFCSSAKNHYYGIPAGSMNQYKGEYNGRINCSVYVLYALGDYIISNFSDEKEVFLLADDAWAAAINLDSIYGKGNVDSINRRSQYNVKRRENIPSYAISTVEGTIRRLENQIKEYEAPGKVKTFNIVLSVLLFFVGINSFRLDDVVFKILSIIVFAAMLCLLYAAMPNKKKREKQAQEYRDELKRQQENLEALKSKKEI